MSVSGKYGTTIDNCNLAIDKAKTKKDGLYCFSGLYYLVKNNKITHYAAYGNIYQAVGVFLVKINSYDHCSDSSLNKKRIKQKLI